MKDIKVIILNNTFYLQASKYFIAEPDAIKGVYNLDSQKNMYIIANSFTEAQDMLVTKLTLLGHYP